MYYWYQMNYTEKQLVFQKMFSEIFFFLVETANVNQFIWH